MASAFMKKYNRTKNDRVSFFFSFSKKKKPLLSVNGSFPLPALIVGVLTGLGFHERRKQ